MNNSTAFDVPNLYHRMKHMETPKSISVAVPGSKSITNRALLLATLGDGVSTLRGVLFSDDSRHFLKCIQDLGFETVVDEAHANVSVTGLCGRIPKKEASIYVGSAGTAARFLTAFLGCSDGTYHLDASEQMRKRPMAPLLNSLTDLGCEITYPAGSKEGFFPFSLRGNGLTGKEITINIDNSSQFLSALLISSTLSKEDFTIRIEGSHGMAYIDMTIRMMEQFGLTVQRRDETSFVVLGNRKVQSLDYQVEPDASAAAYFYALAPLLNVEVLVQNVHFDSMQGDVAFIHILEKMGCQATDTKDGILLVPPVSGSYSGVTVDMSACSDQAITLAAIAPFATSPTTITGIGHIRYQECDRLSAISTELTRMGIRCEETQDSITIYPGTPRPSAVETYEDHRMAMGFALTGLRANGISILNPGCCKKTFENYFEVLTTVINTLAN